MDAFLEGGRDYTKIEGDTGPLVYPAGFLYVYSAIKFLTGGQVFPAQVTAQRNLYNNTNSFALLRLHPPVLSKAWQCLRVLNSWVLACRFCLASCTLSTCASFFCFTSRLKWYGCKTDHFFLPSSPKVQTSVIVILI